MIKKECIIYIPFFIYSVMKNIFTYEQFLNENKSEKSAIILTGEGFQDQELLQPKKSLEDEGVTVTIAGIEKKEVKAYNSDETIDIEEYIGDLNPEDYDILVLPGGKAPDKIRSSDVIIKFVKRFFDTGRPIAAICHGPQVLITAELVDGVTMTCYSDMKDELIEAGANYVDKSLVIDGQFITSREPKDLDEFCSAILSNIK